MFYTYSSHPLACAVADGVLAIMEREQLVERSPRSRRAARRAASKEELSGHPMVGDIRGSGCSGGSSWCMTRRRACRSRRKKRSPIGVLGAAVRDGLFFYPATGMAGKAGGDAMMITPPFIISDAEIEFIVRTARAALDEI